MSYNKATLVGHLGQDPTVRSTQSGQKIVSFSLATSESWRDKQTGERKQRTQWHNVVIFNEGLAKVAEQYLKKGSQVLIEGMLETRKWQDQNGQDRWTTEVVLKQFRGELVMLGGKGDGAQQDGGNGGGQSSGGGGGASGGQASSGGGNGGGGGSTQFDDEIPFAPEFR